LLPKIFNIPLLSLHSGLEVLSLQFVARAFLSQFLKLSRGIWKPCNIAIPAVQIEVPLAKRLCTNNAACQNSFHCLCCPPVFCFPITCSAPLALLATAVSIRSVRELVGVAKMIMVFVGSTVGSFVGSAVGSFVGSTVGSFVGSAVGSFVGSTVGSFVGSTVGSTVGSFVGSNVCRFPLLLLLIIIDGPPS
jgi:hypothetical protein